MKTRRQGIFYGWWVVLTAAVGLFWGAPISVFSFSVFLKPLMQTFNTGRAAISLAYTLGGVAGAISALVAGQLIDRYGARRVILPATAMFGLTLFAPYLAAGFFGGVAVGIALLWTGDATPLASVGAFLVGLGLGAEVDIIAYPVSRYFGLRSFGEIYASAFAAFLLEGALTPFLMGADFDLTGSYGAPPCCTVYRNSGCYCPDDSPWAVPISRPPAGRRQADVAGSGGELTLPLHSERNVWSGSQVAARHAGYALAAVPIVSSRMPALK